MSGKPPVAAARSNGKPAPLERTFQQSVVDLAKRLGWSVYWTHDSRRSPAGWPDLVLTWNPLDGSRGKALFRELKRDTRPSRVTDDQRECLEALTCAGLDAKIWTPSDWDEIQEVLTRRGK